MFGLCNDELEKTSLTDCEVPSVVYFSTIENNSEVEIHHFLHTACGEENVMNLRNVSAMAVDFPRGENKHTQQRAQRVTDNNIR